MFILEHAKKFTASPLSVTYVLWTDAYHMIIIGRNPLSPCMYAFVLTST